MQISFLQQAVLAATLMPQGQLNESCVLIKEYLISDTNPVITCDPEFSIVPVVKNHISTYSSLSTVPQNVSSCTAFKTHTSLCSSFLRTSPHVI